MASSHARGRVERGSRVAALGCILLCACGASSAPNESAIFYDANLRPGVVEPATEAERELLIRLSELPAESVRVGERTFRLGPVYSAASGRRCRLVMSDESRRLACQHDEGWVYVPDVHSDGPPEVP